MGFYSLFAIIVILGFVIFVVIQQMGPTKNKRTIDSSIGLLDERLGGNRPAYKPQEQLFEEFKEACTDSVYLSRMAEDILRHCGMEPNHLQVHAEENLDIEGAAGLYSHGNGWSMITIKVSKYARYNVILAVLIHECMHYFLEHSGIRFPETQENEILTDTTTVYMGFYEYMYHGSVMVGYLRDSEFRYVKHILEKK
ncbi:MAG: hypothetical protein K6B69_03955 [Lachnospiraceae bacterium]|nr:hypothetical protein [Lachnospiraceae bacterium]